MAVANNADDYTNGRVNIFFPAHNSTPLDGNLTGQCVTLVKWFFAEMCNGFPSPFAARGDARYVGKNLVAQGLADEVPYDQRRRGDIICLEYGTYGHIYVQLSGGRVFEENVNWSGVASRVVDGETVYASRIGSDSEAWRATKNPHAYRLKSYNEQGASNMAIPNADNYYNRYRKAMQYIRGRDMSREEFNANFVGNTDLQMLEAMLDSSEADAQLDYANWGRPAKNEHWQDQIIELKKERDNTLYPYVNAVAGALGLPAIASPEGLAAVLDAIAKLKDGNGNEDALKLIIKDKEDQIKQLTDNFTKLVSENDILKKELAAQSGDTELLNSFGQFLQKLIQRLGVKK